MARDLTSPVEAAAAASKIATCHLLTVYLDGQTIYWCDYHRNVTFGAQEYSAAGQLLGFDGLEETSDIAVNAVTVTLSGIDTANISLILSNYYLDRRLTIHRAFFDEDDALIADPVMIFDGRMNRPQIEEDPENGTSNLSVEAGNQFADFERKPGRHTSSDEQRLHFPDDLGLEYATEIDKTLTWGS
ncbi:MAG: hypothetical protein V2J13_11210 [Cycloclasticus sp.]|jgi:hypothetical protein|nr:hypothetical protein [Cycloclasticus sp.]